MNKKKVDNFFPVMDYLQYFEERFFNKKLYAERDIKVNITQKECDKKIDFYIKNEEGMDDDNINFLLSDLPGKEIEIKSIYCISQRNDWKLQFDAANEFFVPMKDKRGVSFELDTDKNIDNILCLYMHDAEYNKIFYKILQSKAGYKLILTNSLESNERTLELTEDLFKKVILWVNLLSRDISEFKLIRSYFDSIDFDEIDSFKNIEKALAIFFGYDLVDIKKQCDLLDMVKL